jgi:hypothetical protein
MKSDSVENIQENIQKMDQKQTMLSEEAKNENMILLTNNQESYPGPSGGTYSQDFSEDVPDKEVKKVTYMQTDGQVISHG